MSASNEGLFLTLDVISNLSKYIYSIMLVTLEALKT